MVQVSAAGMTFAAEADEESGAVVGGGDNGEFTMDLSAVAAGANVVLTVTAEQQLPPAQYEAAGGGEADRINVGTAVLKVTANGGNWTGSTSVLFEITPRQLNADEFSYSVNGDKSFCLLNGTEISGYPLGEVTIMFGDVRVPAAAEWQGVGADGMVRADDEISILITASGNFDGTYTFRNEQLTVYSATVTANGGEPRYFVFAA